MAKPPKSDPTEDPKFKSVVRHFLTTKPQHKTAPKAKATQRRGRAKRKNASRG